jgi:hypothetical protein
MTTKVKTDAYKKTARIVGALFITATATSILGLFGFLDPILSAPDYLLNISANKTQMILGVLIESINSVAVVVIPVMLFPIFRKHNEALSLGYIVSRMIESFILIVGHISQLSLVTISQEYVRAAAQEAAHFQALGTIFLGVYDWTFYLGPGIAFGLTALILNYLLYQSKLVPRWLSVWGFIGALVLITYDMLQIFGFDAPMFLVLPIGLQEMIFAGWLIVKGFNSIEITSGSAK